MNYLLNTYHHLSCCNLKLQHYIRKFSLLSNERPILMFYAAKFRLKKRNTTRATEPVGFRTQKQTEPVYASDRLSGPKLLRNWSLSGYCCLLYCSRGVAWGRFCGFSRLCICQPPPPSSSVLEAWIKFSCFVRWMGTWSVRCSTDISSSHMAPMIAAMSTDISSSHMALMRSAIGNLLEIWNFESSNVFWEKVSSQYWLGSLRDTNLWLQESKMFSHLLILSYRQDNMCCLKRRNSF